MKQGTAVQQASSGDADGESLEHVVPWAEGVRFVSDGTDTIPRDLT